MTVGVVITPGNGARFVVVGEAHVRSDVHKAAAIVSIEAVGTAAEADEIVEVAVVIGVGPGIRVSARRRE